MIGFFKGVFERFGDSKQKHNYKTKTQAEKLETDRLIHFAEEPQAEDSGSLFYYYFDWDIDEEEPDDHFIFI